MNGAEGAAEAARVKADIRRKYARIARWYDLLEVALELLAARRLRRWLLAGATGAVLDVGAGTGRNLPFYPPGARLTLADLSREMLGVAAARARRLARPAALVVADAEALPFPDGRFDSVVSSFALCTYVDPLAALRELSRVCRPGGRILLLEHGRSDRAWLGRFQDRRAARHARILGCHWNREPAELVAQAGLPLRAARRLLLGTLHVIQAAPAQRE